MASWPEFRPTALLKRLVAHGVDFVVVGGIALVAHGSARNTNDLDICYSTHPANLDALAATLTELNATLRGLADTVPFVPDARTLSQLSILTLATSDGDLDLLVGPAGAPAYDALRSRATHLTLDGIAVLIASLDDLEAMKRAADRPVDRIDLEEINVIRRLRQRNELAK